MSKSKMAAAPNHSLRLVKTWLPANVVREMDEAILGSGGAYNGRDEFIREAIADRIAEDRLRPAGGPVPVVRLRPSHSQESRLSSSKPDITGLGPEPSLEQKIGGYAERIPTLPPHHVGGMLYGLHNRDYPTLWATRSLLAMVDERGEPLPWDEFVGVVLEAAWKIGAHLAKLDDERDRGELKAAIGFPANPDKRRSTETRFVQYMLGMPDHEAKPTGPLFALQLAGTRRTNGSLVVAPTKEGAILWDHLAAEGFASHQRPPHPESAWLVFREHLRCALPDDHAAWLDVLRAIADRPTREELIRRFIDRWPGSAADTNVGGYVSRGREWGLVEPKLVDGRYALTERGHRNAQEAKA